MMVIANIWITVSLIQLVSLSHLSGFRLDQLSDVTNGTRWAVLVAGSNGWANYRHQADVCHAYHTLRNHGIPEDHIITFMYDDIANHPANPFKGQLFNDYDHKDYYQGVKINYQRDNVTVNNFVRTLLGCPKLKAKGMKVLESGPKDEVFIYFTDHGATQMIGFPSEIMTATQLNQTISRMHQHHKFEKLVIYLEACESGSMFKNILKSNLNVFVTTAADVDESSWAAFCEDTTGLPCLADEYSYSWIHDTDTHNTRNRTLEQQYQEVKRETEHSHVQEFGDWDLRNSPISEFQGDTSNNEQTKSNRLHKPKDFLPSRDVHIHLLRRQLARNENSEDEPFIQRRLHRAVQLKNMAQETMNDIELLVRKQNPSLTISFIHDWVPCYEAAHTKYMNLCFKMQRVPIVAQLMSRLVQLCKDGYELQVIENAIDLTCN